MLCIPLIVTLTNTSTRTLRSLMSLSRVCENPRSATFNGELQSVRSNDPRGLGFHTSRLNYSTPPCTIIIRLPAIPNLLDYFFSPYKLLNSVKPCRPFLHYGNIFFTPATKKILEIITGKRALIYRIFLNAPHFI